MEPFQYEKVRKHLTDPGLRHNASLKCGESNQGGRTSCVAWPSKPASPRRSTSNALTEASSSATRTHRHRAFGS